MTTIAPALLEHLRALEIALLQPATRADAARLDALLHPDFLEIGASGRRHDKAAILAALAAEASAGPVEFVADGFEARALADDLVLLTWRSARRARDGRLERAARRASLWQRTGATWRIRFHQGTPIAMDDDLPPADTPAS